MTDWKKRAKELDKALGQAKAEAYGWKFQSDGLEHQLTTELDVSERLREQVRQLRAERDGEARRGDRLAESLDTTITERDAITRRAISAEDRSEELENERDEARRAQSVVELRAASWWEAAKGWCRRWEYARSIADSCKRDEEASEADLEGLEYRYRELMERVKDQGETIAALRTDLAAAEDEHARLIQERDAADERKHELWDQLNREHFAKLDVQNRAEKAEADAHDKAQRLARLQLVILNKLGDLINGAACDDDYIRAVEVHSGRGLLREAAEWQKRAKAAEAEIEEWKTIRDRMVAERNSLRQSLLRFNAAAHKPKDDVGSLRNEVSDLRDEVAHIDGVLTQLADGFQRAVTGEGSE